MRRSGLLYSAIVQMLAMLKTADKGNWRLDEQPTWLIQQLIEHMWVGVSNWVSQNWVFVDLLFRPGLYEQKKKNGFYLKLDSFSCDPP